MSDTDVQNSSPNIILGAQQGMDKQSPCLQEWTEKATATGNQ